MPRVKLFLRIDRFDRFVSALVYAPRERIDARLRSVIHRLLAKAFDGRITASMSRSMKARWYACITSSAATRGPRPQVDTIALERDIAAAIETWTMPFCRRALRPAWARRRPAPRRDAGRRFQPRLSRPFRRP